MKGWVRILAFVAGAVICSMCSSKVVSNESAQTATADLVMELTTNELDDLAHVILDGFSNSGPAAAGRLDATFVDDRLTCANSSIVFSNVAADKTSGKVVITFPPDGCSDGVKSNNRRGIITITWSGEKWYRIGSTVTITLTNYSINGVSITGTRTWSCTAFNYVSNIVYSVTWTVKASHTLSWPDGTTATFNVEQSRAWARGAATDHYTYTNGPDGNAATSGTNRHGKAFTTSIATGLVYTRACIIISKNYKANYGVKTLNYPANGASMTFNYGDGSCLDTYTLTADGASKVYHAKNDSSDD